LQAASRNGHNGHDTDAPGVEPSEQDLAVFEKRLAGHSVYSIAKQMNLPVKEVDAAIDRACTPIDDDFRLRTINLELERFDHLCSVFYQQALDGDPAAAAMLVMRVSERRSAIWASTSHPPPARTR
jgi:hypothetical protein